ncbi:MAG: GNAT family N-acetyltransferase [Blautia sp.]|nr:GNAT family N-acetyltransferase [Blautia sp.]
MIRELDRCEMAGIYRTQMQEDFPPAERKPWERIEQMIEDGVYFACGLYEDETLMAYAFCVETKGGYVLLDYYAVAEQARGKGIGSRFLELFREKLSERGCRALLLEVENPAFAGTEEEHRNQERRIRFYEKNGITLTKHRSRLFGVEYRIMILPVLDEFTEALVPGALDEIYHTMFPEKYFGREVVIHGDQSVTG